MYQAYAPLPVRRRGRWGLWAVIAAVVVGTAAVGLGVLGLGLGWFGTGPVAAAIAIALSVVGVIYRVVRPRRAQSPMALVWLIGGFAALIGFIVLVIVVAVVVPNLQG